MRAKGLPLDRILEHLEQAEVEVSSKLRPSLPTRIQSRVSTPNGLDRTRKGVRGEKDHVERIVINRYLLESI